MLKKSTPLVLALASLLILLSVFPGRQLSAKDGEDDDSGGSSSASSLSSAPAGAIEFRGFVVSVKDDVWTVAGRRVIVNALTLRKGNLAVGSFVKVAGRAQNDGSLLALQIGPADDGPTASPAPGTGKELEIRGVVSFAGDGVWVIAGWVVVKDANTELKGGIRVNTKVKVEGRMQNDGSVLAREIELDDQNR